LLGLNLLTVTFYGTSALLSAFAALAIITRHNRNGRRLPRTSATDLSGDALIFLI